MLALSPTDLLSSLKPALLEPRDVLKAPALKLFILNLGTIPRHSGATITLKTVRKYTLRSTEVPKLYYYSNILTLKNWILTLY